MSRIISGLDVSHHQSPDSIDYRKVAEVPHQFVIARACHGRQPDGTFVAHLVEAHRTNKLLVGGYTFFRQTQSVESQENAFVRQIDALVDGLCGSTLSGHYHMIMPVVDLEWNEKYDGKVDKDAFNTKGRELCRRLRKRYGNCMVYLAPGFFQLLGSPEWLKEYPWWVAHYNVEEPWMPPGAPPRYLLWQRTGTGRTAGYGGDIDLNRAHPSIDSMDALYDAATVPMIHSAADVPVEPPGPDSCERKLAHARETLKNTEGHCDALDERNKELRAQLAELKTQWMADRKLIMELRVALIDIQANSSGATTVADDALNRIHDKISTDLKAGEDA